MPETKDAREREEGDMIIFFKNDDDRLWNILLRSAILLSRCSIYFSKKVRGCRCITTGYSLRSCRTMYARCYRVVWLIGSILKLCFLLLCTLIASHLVILSW